MFRVSARQLVWLIAYGATLALVTGGVFYGRRQALATYGSAQSQTDWNEWRRDAAEMAQAPGPVQRRAPKSAEPPALVLMRDYFAACLALSIVLSSVLFATFMFFLRGVTAPKCD